MRVVADAVDHGPAGAVRLPPVIVEPMILTVDEVSVEMVPGLVPRFVGDARGVDLQRPTAGGFERPGVQW